MLGSIQKLQDTVLLDAVSFNFFGLLRQSKNQYCEYQGDRLPDSRHEYHVRRNGHPKVRSKISCIRFHDRVSELPNL